jgi:ketosteroid isomerase-like protein
MAPVDPLEIAERLFRAIEAGDVAAVRALYAPDAVIWHNFDREEQTVEKNLRVLEWMVRSVRELRYDEIRREKTERGFVQQHVLRGRAPSGAEIAVPACMVVTVREGCIVRIEEYLDSAQVAPLVSS